MKKSEAYHLAQIAVLCAATITHENKLKILKVLFDDEQLALYSEGRIEVNVEKIKDVFAE